MKVIKALLLSGFSHHDWKKSAPFCKDLLEKTGLFSVVMALDPNAALADPEALRDYDLFIVDYHWGPWNEVAKVNFESAIRNGTGLVLLHGTPCSFGGWVEFEKMAGLCWREGTGHGDYHEFKCEIVDTEHPITRGMTDFTIWDELWFKMTPMHGVPYRVLATAYSSPEKKGSGSHEPTMIVTQYGKARVLNQTLGHVWPGNPPDPYKGHGMLSLNNASFQRSLIRGCEWAATGEATFTGQP